MKSLKDIGEFGLINYIKRQSKLKDSVVCGIGDDAAVLKFGTKDYLIFATDMLIEDVHFTRKSQPALIGRKALACNISDVAAMGGRPESVVISLGAPASVKMDWIKKLFGGMKKISEEFDVSIVGGDTVKSQKIIINVAILGRVKKTELVRRSGAKSGDLIFATGPLGKSLMTGKHFSFIPRVNESQFLVKTCKPTSMIDVSDGLAADLGHILHESRAGAVIYEGLIPRHADANLNSALYDGEDYELVFTVDYKKADKYLRMRRKPFSFYPIGKIVDKRKGFKLIDTRGRLKKVHVKGYRHF